MKRLLAIIAAGLLVAHAHADAASERSASDEQATRHATAPPRVIEVFKYRDRSGVTSFSDRAPPRGRYEVIRIDSGCYACNPQSRVDWHSTPLQLQAFRGAIDHAASKYRVDPALVRAVIHAESAFRQDAISKQGAVGLMQLMPRTAEELGVENRLSPEENIDGGVRYLARLLQRSGGNVLLATAAYNAGPGAVDRYKGVPPFAETRTYVKRVKILHERYRSALSDS